MTRKTFRNKITTDELLSQVNKENVKLAERFLKEKKSRSSELTITGYSSDLDIFFVWNLQNNDNKLFTDIRKIELADFFSYCIEELKWGSARFSRAKSTLSSFSNFIEKFFDEDFPKFRNIVLKAVESMPKNARREKTILTDNQVDELFKYLEDNNEFQISCWLALSIGSGSRFSELLRFTTDIIDINHTAFEDIFIETLKSIKTKGRGVGGKMLYKYIIKDIFIKRYLKWIEIRSEIMKNNNKDHNFIFIKPNGDPATESVARGWVEKIERFLDVPFYPHCTRHYTTTYLSKMGLPYNLIKEIFGWESVDMVSVYDDVTAKDKKWEALEKWKDNLDKVI